MRKIVYSETLWISLGARGAFITLIVSSLVIDTTRMSWVITEQPRYNIAMITFDNSPIQSITGTDTSYIPLTFQTTNTIGVQAYLTLTLDSGGLGRENTSSGTNIGGR